MSSFHINERFLEEFPEAALIIEMSGNPLFGQDGIIVRKDISDKETILLNIIYSSFELLTRLSSGQIGVKPFDIFNLSSFVTRWNKYDANSALASENVKKLLEKPLLDWCAHLTILNHSTTVNNENNVKEKVGKLVEIMRSEMEKNENERKIEEDPDLIKFNVSEEYVSTFLDSVEDSIFLNGQSRTIYAEEFEKLFSMLEPMFYSVTTDNPLTFDSYGHKFKISIDKFGEFSLSITKNALVTVLPRSVRNKDHRAIARKLINRLGSIYSVRGTQR